MSDELCYLKFDRIARDDQRDDAVCFEIDRQSVWIPRSLLSNDYEHDKTAEVPWWWVEKEGLEAYASVDET